MAKKEKKSAAVKKSEKAAPSKDCIRVLFAASEVYPLVKTGGLADVACYLPVALTELGHDVRIVLPAYRPVLDQVSGFKPGKARPVKGLDTQFRIFKGRLPGYGVPVYLVDIPELFDRPGGPYQDESKRDWEDNALRFALFGRVVHMLAQGSAGIRWYPDIVHCNDWHTGLAPALLDMDVKRPATVFSIHNLAYQGDFSYDIFRTLGLPDSLWSPDSMEFYGRFSFIKGGLVYADRLTTVSPEYASEIRTPECGYGLEGLLTHRGKVLSGILNGVDYQFWDPRYDPMIQQKYWISSLEDKKINKRHLQQALGLQENRKSIMLAHISRLAWQKGIDLILESVNDLMKMEDVQLVVLGAGETYYENALRDTATGFPGRMAVSFEYDETLAHSILAGGDILLMPSRFEPCGLTQMYGLRYGTIPVVRRTGGLADTIVDTTESTLQDQTATGFQFIDATNEDFLKATLAAIEFYRSPARWEQIMTNAMQKEFTWKRSARKYEKVYRGILKK